MKEVKIKCPPKNRIRAIRAAHQNIIREKIEYKLKRMHWDAMLCWRCCRLSLHALLSGITWRKIDAHDTMLICTLCSEYWMDVAKEWLGRSSFRSCCWCFIIFIIIVRQTLLVLHFRSFTLVYSLVLDLNEKPHIAVQCRAEQSIRINQLVI